MKIGIIGGGPAGTFTAKKLKALLPEAEIVLYDSGICGLYTKLRMPEFIANDLPKEKLIMASPEQLKADGIDLRCGVTVSSLDAAGRSIRTSDGNSETFDKIILATGANPVLPGIPGLNQRQNVYLLRSLSDAERIHSAAEKADRSWAVIGGGVLGLELAFALSRRGRKVTVLEALDRLLPRLLSPAQSEELRNLLESGGVQVRVGCRIGEVTADAIRLSDEVIAADELGVSAGICPEIRLAKEAGLHCGRGICVNEQLMTSADGIYAAGDCAEQNGVTGGLWMAAKGQGEALAEIIAEKRDNYVYPAYLPVLKIAGLDLSAVKKIK